MECIDEMLMNTGSIKLEDLRAAHAQPSPRSLLITTSDKNNNVVRSPNNHNNWLTDLLEDLAKKGVNTTNSDASSPLLFGPSSSSADLVVRRQRHNNYMNAFLQNLNSRKREMQNWQREVAEMERVQDNKLQQLSQLKAYQRMYQEMYQEAWERRKGVVEKLRQQLTDVEERASRVRTRWNEQWSQVQVEKKRIEWVIESLESKIKGQNQMEEDQ